MMVKNMDPGFRVIGFIAAVGFLAIVLTPLPNYAGAYFGLSAAIQASEAIVVLGAGMRRGGMLDDESLRRTIRGIELYKMHWAPLLIFSGPVSNDRWQVSEAGLRTQLALTLGVPRQAIIKGRSGKIQRGKSLFVFPELSIRYDSIVSSWSLNPFICGGLPISSNALDSRCTPPHRTISTSLPIRPKGD